MVTSRSQAIVEDLSRLTAVIRRAQADASAATEHAGRVAQQAAAAGYAAIARQLTAIRGQITTVHTVLGDAASAAQNAHDAVEQVTDTMHPTDTAARLTAASGQLTAMRGALHTTVQQLQATSGHVQQALRGGQPGPLLQRLDAIRQLATLAAQTGAGAATAIAAAITAAGALGAASSAAPGALTQVPQPQDPSSWPPPETRERIAAFVEQARAELPPDIDEHTPGRTHGRWCDEQGEPGAPLVSGREDEDYRRAAAMLKMFAADRGYRARIDMAHHVEMKLAAIMREKRLSDATVVINHVTCGERPAQADWPLACAKLVPKVLYPGQRMHVVGAGGWTKTYTGGQP